MRKRFLVQFILEVDSVQHSIPTEVDEAVYILNRVTESIGWAMADDDELHDVRIVRLIDAAPVLDVVIRGRAQ